MNLDHFEEGIRLFNRRAFFEAHEALEDVWRAAPEPEKKFLQGLIQVAVALHHYGNGNLVGARSLMSRASRNLSAYPKQYAGIDLQRLRHTLGRWECALAESAPAPEPPTL